MLALVFETIDEEWGAELRARDEMLAFGGTENYVRRHATVQCYLLRTERSRRQDVAVSQGE
jgi:hypothetical protein